MAGITSRSSYPGGEYESYTEGPGGGEFSLDIPGRGGGSYEDMASALLSEGLSSARQKRKQAAERFSWERRAERKKYAPKLETAPKSRPMDPMRYANQARMAARNAQFARGGMGSYGQGQLAMEHAGERAFEHAMSAYPMYYQAMMA